MINNGYETLKILYIRVSGFLSKVNVLSKKKEKPMIVNLCVMITWLEKSEKTCEMVFQGWWCDPLTTLLASWPLACDHWMLKIILCHKSMTFLWESPEPLVLYFSKKSFLNSSPFLFWLIHLVLSDEVVPLAFFNS